MFRGQTNLKDLKRLYLTERLSTYSIAKKYNCDPKTVYFHLKKNNIPIRKKKSIRISKAELQRQYVTRKNSLLKIGQLYGFSAAGILKKLKEYNIPRRSASETSTKHLKADFIDSKTEKAYIIGFRLGDLGVRKVKNLIHISSSTTKPEQDALIKSLFVNYGPIWTGRPNKTTGAWNISCSLNFSFKFLLPKHTRIPKWIMRRNAFFLSFIAGYIDAEGNFQISNGRARFRLRSYDYFLLRDIAKWMKEKNIPHTFFMAGAAGIDTRGVRRNKNCWCLAVQTKDSLALFLPKVIPLLRHKKRINDALLALDNVKRRIQ